MFVCKLFDISTERIGLNSLVTNSSLEILATQLLVKALHTKTTTKEHAVETMYSKAVQQMNLVGRKRIPQHLT